MTKGKCWFSTDGKPFATLAEMQRVELENILEGLPLAPKAGEKFQATIADHLITNAEKIVNVLTLKDSSHPKARKAATAGEPAKKRGRKFVPEALPLQASGPAE